MLNKIFKTVILGAFTLVLLITITSCQKAKDTIGVIIVKDVSGNTIPEATVTLHQDGAISQEGNSPNPDLRKTDETDENGRAEFTYELEAIFQVDVRVICDMLLLSVRAVPQVCPWTSMCLIPDPHPKTSSLRRHIEE